MSDEDADSKPSDGHGFVAQSLLRAGQARTLPAHALLCQEGQVTDRFFVITAGEVEIAKTIAGESRALATSGPGAVLALMPAIDGQPCTVTMRTLGDTTVVEITRGNLFALLDPDQATDFDLGHDLALIVIRRLRGATDELARTLFQALRASPRAGRIDPTGLAYIQAGNHAWPCAKLAA